MLGLSDVSSVGQPVIQYTEWAIATHAWVHLHCAEKRLFISRQQLFKAVTLETKHLHEKHKLPITQSRHQLRLTATAVLLSASRLCHAGYIYVRRLAMWPCVFVTSNVQMKLHAFNPVRRHCSTHNKSSLYTQVTLRLYCVDRIHIINMQITSWRHTKIVAIFAACIDFLCVWNL